VVKVSEGGDITHITPTATPATAPTKAPSAKPNPNFLLIIFSPF